MRRRLASIPPPVLAGALVFLTSFALYAGTTQQLTGYEPETGAIAEGLVREGQLRDFEDPEVPSLRADLIGRDGYAYGRAGILQPVLEAPFYAAGYAVDELAGWYDGLPYRLVFLWFYNPFVGALAALAFFALVYLTRRSLGWAAALAMLFAVASIAWPYAKIGMETTFTFAAIASLALAAWARREPKALSWALTGFASGAAASTKPYAIVVFLPIAVLLWRTFGDLDRERRLRLLVAIGVPILAWGAVIAWYNWYRFGGITDFGYSDYGVAFGAPLNVLGLLFSPGKGLVLYSPLVVLGALGMVPLWRRDRPLAISLLCMLGALTLIVGAPTYWSDETWGPRYIVPAAWTLLVPIAWWADTRLRQRVLAGVAVLALLVQVVGISLQYGRYVEIAKRLTGVPLYETRAGLDRERIPYGDDPTRWVPELSALLVQSETLISSQVVSRFGGEGLKVTYHPFEGRSRTVNLSDPALDPELDLWWNEPYEATGGRVAGVLMLIVALGGGGALWWVSSGANASRRGRQLRAH